MENLSEYFEAKTPGKFRSAPHYFADGDFVSFYFSDERCYAKRVDDLLTVYYSDETDELVGCKIKGVALLLQTLKEDFAVVVVHGGRVQLGLLFLSAAACSTAEDKTHYRELGEHAKDASIPADKLPLAA